MLIIKFMDGENKGIQKEFDIHNINIGSNPKNHIVFNDSENVSPNHALIKIEPNRIILFSHSQYGTFVNNKQVKKAVIPTKGIIKFGLSGPSIEYIRKQNEEKEFKTLENNEKVSNQRWYDKDILVSKAIELLRISEDERVTKVANELIKLLNKQDPNALFVMPNVVINNEIDNLPRQARWYDLNKSIQKVIETLKFCQPEMQENLALEIITMLDDIEIKKKSEKEIELETINIEESKTAQETLQEAKRDKLDSKEPPSKPTCKNCDYDLKEGDRFCPNCGFNLEKNLITRYKLKTCPQCNESIHINSNVCLKCNYRFETEPPEKKVFKCSSCGSNLTKEGAPCPECDEKTKEPDDSCMYYCIACGEYIRVNAEICPKCGVKQDILTDGAVEKHCYECGQIIKANAEICPKCGVAQKIFTKKKGEVDIMVNPNHSKSANEKHCHECGEIIKINAEICPKCGVKQDILTDGAVEKHCYECGQIIKANAEICPKCGVAQKIFTKKKVTKAKIYHDINWRDLDQTTLIICCALNLFTLPGIGYIVAGNKEFGIKMLVGYFIYAVICIILTFCSLLWFIIAWIPIELIVRSACTLLIFLEKK